MTYANILLHTCTRRFCLISGLMVCLGQAYCQPAKKDTALNRTVIVENEYNPDITDASKINILPAVEDPVVSPANIEYAIRELPAATFGAYQAMPSFAAVPTPSDSKNGYARLGYGNYGNADIKLGYLFRISPRDLLDVSLFLDGRNGKLKLPAPVGIDLETVDWKSRFYASGINLAYAHLFQKFKLDVSANLGTDNFNYHQLPVRDEAGQWIYQPGFIDNQHQLKGQLRTSLASSGETDPLQFKVAAGYSYFKKKYTFGDEYEDKEQVATLTADVWGRINERQEIGLKLDLNSFFYSVGEFENYTSLQLNPYYRLEGEKWKLKLGAHVDFSFGKGRVLEFAPDIDFRYVFAKNHSVVLKAAGGRVLNDFRQMSAANPYWAIYRADWWKNSYLPLDASLGLISSPVSGLRLHLFAGYRMVNHDLCFGNFFPENSMYAYAYVQTADLKEIYAGLEASYAYKDFLDLSVLATYNHWNDRSDELLLMKPELELKFRADFKITPSLFVNLGYDYVSRPEVVLNSFGNFSGATGGKYRMKPVSDLSLGLTYRFLKGCSAFVKLDNLLNKEYQYYYSYPSEKLNFLAGLSVTF